MAIKLKSNSANDGQLQESNTANRQYYLPDNDSGLGTKLMTAQATTSGTSIDFTSIPSWVKRITVMLQGVSTNGTSYLIIRLGTSGGFVASGYLGSAASANYTTGLPVDDVANAAGVRHGIVTIVNITGTSWVSGSMMGRSDGTGAVVAGGSVTLGAALTRVRLTTVNGTDVFDAGSINVMYE